MRRARRGTIEMSDRIERIGATRVLFCAPEGRVLKRSGDANDFISTAFEQDVGLVAIPLSRLDPDFLRLRSGLAGEVLQKFVNYGVRLAILGDISGHVALSDALRDFIREANCGTSTWFVPDEEELTRRLGG